jgi:hypothetical protein
LGFAKNSPSIPTGNFFVQERRFFNASSINNFWL